MEKIIKVGLIALVVFFLPFYLLVASGFVGAGALTWAIILAKIAPGLAGLPASLLSALGPLAVMAIALLCFSGMVSGIDSQMKDRASKRKREKEIEQAPDRQKARRVDLIAEEIAELEIAAYEKKHGRRMSRIAKRAVMAGALVEAKMKIEKEGK